MHYCTVSLLSQVSPHYLLLSAFYKLFQTSFRSGLCSAQNSDALMFILLQLSVYYFDFNRYIRPCLSTICNLSISLLLFTVYYSVFITQIATVVSIISTLIASHPTLSECYLERASAVFISSSILQPTKQIVCAI